MALDNKQIYKKTIGFSIRRLLWDVLAWGILIGLCVAGFFIAESASNAGLVGLGIGLIVGAIIMYIILHYVAFSYKAGQIAMMTEGVSTGKLPDDVVGEGKRIVKKRFTTVAAYYAVTGAIRGIFRQLGNAITAVGKAVGGDGGSAVGSAISGVIDTIVEYLCDCCLGWVFYQKDKGAMRATLEGAVIFFKHGKTLAKNLGRVFGIGLLSLLVIGGVFTGIFYLVFMNFPDLFNQFAQLIVEKNANPPEFLTNATTLTVICSVIGGVLLWGIIHSTFVRPFILVGVLRNYIKSGMDEKIDEKEFAALDGKSEKFKKLHAEVDAGKK